ncbi:MAG: PIG-L family deacetylase [Lentisphaeria bacterium]
MQDYKDFVNTLVKTFEDAKHLPLGDVTNRPEPETTGDAPCAILMSPHPDDECIIGTLPLRLMHRNKFQVTNIAVTQGSRKDRQGARFKELQQACRYLGFNLRQTQAGGLEKIKPSTRNNDPTHWRTCVRTIADILQDIAPQVLFLPHAQDWNGTHIGTHFLVMDALSMMPSDFTCTIIETEYWQPMPDPNLMIESTPEILAELITALSFHKGEVARNPYHLSLPAWMQDNVRRGGELVGGQGEAAPDFHFATLYRVSRWEQGTMTRSNPTTSIVPESNSFDLPQQ